MPWQPERPMDGNRHDDEDDEDSDYGDRDDDGDADYDGAQQLA